MSQDNSTEDPYDIAELHFDNQCSVLRDGTVVPWDSMYDDEGDETDDVEEAVTVVHPLPNGEWVTLVLDDYLFSPKTIH